MALRPRSNSASPPPATGPGRYQVLDPLRHDGVDYPVGAVVALATDAAAPLLAMAVIVAQPDAAP